MADREKVIEGLIQIRLHFEAMISICTDYRDYRGYDELREYTENAVSFIKGNGEVLQVNNKTAERRTRQNARLLSMIKENILLAREHKRKGDMDSCFRVMSFVKGMMYACGIMRPQFRWAKKINEFYDVLNEQTET